MEIGNIHRKSQEIGTKNVDLKKSFFEEQFRIKVVTVFQEKEESSIEGGGELRWERREYVRK